MARLPVEHFGGAFDDRDGARIGKALQAIRDGVFADGSRDFIDQAFDGPAVRDLAGRADVAGAQRRILQAVNDDAGVRRCVRRVEIFVEAAGPAALALLDAGGIESDQRDGAFGADPHRDPGLGFPRDDVALRVGGGAELDGLRRALGIPPVLVVTHPLHAHGAADRFRENGGVGAGVLVSVLTVAAGAFEVDQANLVEGQVEAFGEDVAEEMRGLRAGPDGEAVGMPVGDGAGGTHRSVSLVREVEAGGEMLLAAGHRLLGVAAFHGRLVVIDGALAEEGRELGDVGEAGPVAPLRVERGGGAHGRPFGLGDDAEEVVDADHAHVGDAGDGRLVRRRGASRPCGAGGSRGRGACRAV